MCAFVYVCVREAVCIEVGVLMCEIMREREIKKCVLGVGVWE